MTSPTDPEVINRRLATAQFVSHPADRVYFENLVNLVRSLAQRFNRNVEGLIPDVNSAGAWSRMYEVYIALKQLADVPHDPAIHQRAMAAKARDDNWNRYIHDRELFIELMRRGDIGRLASEYLGLVPGDLGPPTSNDPEVMRYGGRRLDWNDVAWRLNQALGQWHSMSKGEKASIPIVMATRRNEAAARELAKRMETLEAKDQPTTENAA